MGACSSVPYTDENLQTNQHKPYSEDEDSDEETTKKETIPPAEKLAASGIATGKRAIIIDGDHAPEGHHAALVMGETSVVVPAPSSSAAKPASAFEATSDIKLRKGPAPTGKGTAAPTDKPVMGNTASIVVTAVSGSTGTKKLAPPSSFSKRASGAYRASDRAFLDNLINSAVKEDVDRRKDDSPGIVHESVSNAGGMGTIAGLSGATHKATAWTGGKAKGPALKLAELNKIIFPTPGFILKTKREVLNNASVGLKVFINICHSDKVKELVINPATVTLDKNGTESIVYTACMTTNNYMAALSKNDDHKTTNDLCKKVIGFINEDYHDTLKESFVTVKKANNFYGEGELTLTLIPPPPPSPASVLVPELSSSSTSASIPATTTPATTPASASAEANSAHLPVSPPSLYTTASQASVHNTCGSAKASLSAINENEGEEERDDQAPTFTNGESIKASSLNETTSISDSSNIIGPDHGHNHNHNKDTCCQAASFEIEESGVRPHVYHGEIEMYNLKNKDSADFQYGYICGGYMHCYRSSTTVNKNEVALAPPCGANYLQSICLYGYKVVPSHNLYTHHDPTIVQEESKGKTLRFSLLRDTSVDVSVADLEILQICEPMVLTMHMLTLSSDDSFQWMSAITAHINYATKVALHQIEAHGQSRTVSAENSAILYSKVSDYDVIGPQLRLHNEKYALFAKKNEIILMQSHAAKLKGFYNDQRYMMLFVNPDTLPRIIYFDPNTMVLSSGFDFTDDRPIICNQKNGTEFEITGAEHATHKTKTLKFRVTAEQCMDWVTAIKMSKTFFD